MEITVRRLYAEETDAALALAWKTFLEFEAPDFGEAGVATFRRDTVENEAFKNKFRLGENRLWGALDGEKLVGIMAIRDQSHLCLVFTDKDYHRKGIATAIFKKLTDDIRRETPDVKRITVNSSPYGKPFYHRVGFTDTDTEQTVGGMRFTPMEYSVQNAADTVDIKE